MNILAGKRSNRRHSPTSFSENVVLADTSYEVLYRLNYFAAERYSLTSFNKDNSANFFGEKDVQGSYPGCLLFENTRENL